MRKVLIVSMLVLFVLLMIVPLSTQAADCGTHVVRQGENLFRIGLRYGISYHTLAAYNGIYDPTRIYAGQVIRIPCGGTATGQQTVTVYDTNQQYYYTNPAATTDPQWGTTNPYGTASSGTAAVQQEPPVAVDCSGFQATSPGAFPNGTITFYWDPPRMGEFIARYQVRVLNAVGRQVGAFETFGLTSSLNGDVSLASIGPGINFSYYVVGVTADNQICRTATRPVQREWTGTVDPTH